MFKVALIRSKDSIEIKEFKTKPEAISFYVEYVNAICEQQARLKKFIRRDNEVFIRGDLFFGREYNGTNEYIVMVGPGMEDFRKPEKYKYIVKHYLNHLL